MKNNNNNKIIGISVLVLLVLVIPPTTITTAYGQITLNNTTTTTTANTTSTRTAESLAQLRAEDPSFDAFHNIMDQCTDNTLYGNGTISHFQCLQSLQQGVDKWCGIENYHKDKCESASLTLSLYVSTYDLFTKLGVGGASGGSLDNPQTPYSSPSMTPSEFGDAMCDALNNGTCSGFSVGTGRAPE